MATATSEKVDKYDVLEKIGHGSFGTIRKVRRRSDGLVMCRKEINYIKMSQREREQLHAEFSILSSLRHDSIVKYYHREHLKESQELHIYMEWCGGGDLGKKIRDNKMKGVRPAESYVWGVLAQLSEALFRCHFGEDPLAVGSDVLAPPPSPKKLRLKTQMTILHRDLKPENIFLGDDDSIKLGDFGLSKAIAAHDLASTYVGTPYYMSPEIVAAERYGPESDVWAMGCIIYELCDGRPPFDARTHFHLVQKIKDGKFESLPSCYSEDLRNVVSRCLQVNPSKRPTTKEIVNLPLVRLMRSQRETLQLARLFKDKEILANQRIAEAEASLTRWKADRLQQTQQVQGMKTELTLQIREELKTEIDDRLRREWEVKARLEIDRRVKEQQENLQGQFDRAVEMRVQAEVAKQVDSIRKSLIDSTSSSQVPALSPIGTAGTPPSDLSSHMSAISFDSPVNQIPAINALTGKKPGRTPLTRARTQIESPMDVQMTSPSSMYSSLSLSPRQEAAMAGDHTAGANLFIANAAAARQRWQPQLMSDINSEDEDDDLPPLPSPTRAPRGPFGAGTGTVSKDPFRAAAPARPAFRRQNTMPANNTLGQQPSLFSTGGGVMEDKGVGAIAQLPKPAAKLRSPTSPTRRPLQRAPLTKATTAAGGEDMFKAVTQKNMFAAGSQQPVHPTNPVAIPATTGRTLVELSQARVAPAPTQLAKQDIENRHDLYHEAKGLLPPPAVWDPERDDMPSPFLTRVRKIGGLGAR